MWCGLYDAHRYLFYKRSVRWVSTLFENSSTDQKLTVFMCTLMSSSVTIWLGCMSTNMCARHHGKTCLPNGHSPCNSEEVSGSVWGWEMQMSWKTIKCCMVGSGSGIVGVQERAPHRRSREGPSKTRPKDGVRDTRNRTYKYLLANDK